MNDHPPTREATTRPGPASQEARPPGVAVLAVLSLLGMLLTGFVGLVLLIGGGLLGLLVGTFAGPLGGVLPLLGVLLSVPLFAVSITHAATAWGLWNGRRWGWALAIGLAVVWGLWALVDLLIADPSGLGILVVSGASLWYLFRPDVRAWFGRRERKGT